MYIGTTPVEVGDKITFTTVNLDDVNVYSGTVTAITTASIAKIISDIAAYHTVIMAKYWGTKPKTNWQSLTYVVITDAQNKSHAISTDWINTDTLDLLDEVKDIVVSVTGVPNNGIGLLTYLRAGGYNASIVSSV